MPAEFYDLVSHHLPPEQPVGPQGGRPRVPHRIILQVIWFVLATGCRWEDVPLELGCSGRSAHRRLRCWEEEGIWDRLHADLLRQADKLDPDLAIVDSVMVRAFGGGEETGPSPVDRRKKGSKHTLLVDRHGVPLEIHSAAANDSDQRQIIPLILDFPKVGGKPGRPKELPDTLIADAGYDNDATRWLLRWLGPAQHVLPGGFQRIPHDRLLASRTKQTLLARCRELLGADPPPPPEKKSATDWLLLLLGIDPLHWPRCGQALEPTELPHQRGPATVLAALEPATRDTS
jgi:transposase